MSGLMDVRKALRMGVGWGHGRQHALCCWWRPDAVAMHAGGIFVVWNNNLQGSRAIKHTLKVIEATTVAMGWGCQFGLPALHPVCWCILRRCRHVPQYLELTNGAEVLQTGNDLQARTLKERYRSLSIIDSDRHCERLLYIAPGLLYDAQLQATDEKDSTNKSAGDNGLVPLRPTNPCAVAKAPSSRGRGPRNNPDTAGCREEVDLQSVNVRKTSNATGAYLRPSTANSAYSLHSPDVMQVLSSPILALLYIAVGCRPYTSTAPSEFC